MASLRNKTPGKLTASSKFQASATTTEEKIEKVKTNVGKVDKGQPSTGKSVQTQSIKTEKKDPKLAGKTSTESKTVTKVESSDKKSGKSNTSSKFQKETISTTKTTTVTEKTQGKNQIRNITPPTLGGFCPLHLSDLSRVELRLGTKSEQNCGHKFMMVSMCQINLTCYFFNTCIQIVEYTNYYTLEKLFNLLNSIFIRTSVVKFEVGRVELIKLTCKGRIASQGH